MPKCRHSTKYGRAESCWWLCQFCNFKKPCVSNSDAYRGQCRKENLSSHAESLYAILLELKWQPADCMVWFLDPFRTWKIVWRCVCLGLSETIFFPKIMALFILSQVCTALKKKEKNQNTEHAHSTLQQFQTQARVMKPDSPNSKVSVNHFTMSLMEK